MVLYDIRSSSFAQSEATVSSDQGLCCPHWVAKETWFLNTDSEDSADCTSAFVGSVIYCLLYILMWIREMRNATCTCTIGEVLKPKRIQAKNRIPIMPCELDFI